MNTAVKVRNTRKISQSSREHWALCFVPPKFSIMKIKRGFSRFVVFSVQPWHLFKGGAF